MRVAKTVLTERIGGAHGRSGAAGRALLAFTCALCIGTPVAAQSTLTTDITVLGSLVRSAALADADEPPWRATTLGSGTIGISAEGSENVRGAVALGITAGDQALIDLSRAWVRVRLPSVRLTVGKTLLAWGDGFAFNAGDLFAPDTDPAAGLTADELRSNAVWQITGYVPLGFFSFLEVVAAPAPFGLATYEQLAAAAVAEGAVPPAQDAPEVVGATTRALRDTPVGARAYLTLGGSSLQVGFLREPLDAAANRRPQSTALYASWHGAILVDAYAAARITVPVPGDPAWDGLDTGLVDLGEAVVSGGAFHSLRLPRDQQLAIRIEGEWRSGDGGANRSQTRLYPELSWTVSPTVTAGVRGVVDGNGAATMTALVSWGVDQGLTFVAYPGIAVAGGGGEWELGEVTLAAGLRYIF